MEEKYAKKLAGFFGQYKTLRYKKHENILHADDIPSGVYFISEGYAREFVVSPDGEELTLLVFRPSDFFPIRWALTNVHNTKYFQAMTPLVVHRAPRDAFIDFLQKNPDVLFAFTCYVLHRIGFLLNRMEKMTFGHAKEKIASIIDIMSERVGTKNGNESRLDLPLTHRDIGYLAGMTRETTSLELEKLQKKGLITYKNHILTVCDIEALKKEIGEA